MSKHAPMPVIIRWDEGNPAEETVDGYVIVDARTSEVLADPSPRDAAATRVWAEGHGYEVARVEFNDKDRALMLGAAREQMERTIEDTRKALENEVRVGLRHIAAVAAVLAPSATHVVLAMGDLYDNPVYTPYLLIDADAPPSDMIDTQVVWSFDWHSVEANEIRALLRLVRIGRAFDEPMVTAALDDAEGDAVISGAYLSGDNPYVVPLANLR